LLLRPGELRALRVADADSFRLVLSMGQALPGGGTASSYLAQALDSLCAVELWVPPGDDNAGLHAAAAVIERCAGTVTKLKGFLPGDLLCESDSFGHPSVLARCTRLEVLVDALRYAPAVWLGLSQLHTLHHVDLTKVSTAAIAAALPRLHTLTANSYGFLASSVTGFFTDLLPRLRVFHFHGNWPVETEEPVAVTAPPLPLLEELDWQAELSPQPTVFRRFFGARPLVLRAYYERIVECLPDGGRGASDDPANGLLIRACEVLIYPGSDPLDLREVARVLRAAPRLRSFDFTGQIRGDTSWLTASSAPIHSAFAGLVHRRLRYFSLTNVALSVPFYHADDDDDDDHGWASRLRRTCFPRLHRLQVNPGSFAYPLAG
jgi:hypothetical protein